MNSGVCIEGGFMFFLKKYYYRLFIKVCLIFYHAILIASFSTLSHTELSDFSFFCFSPFADWAGSEVWASSAWDGVVGTPSARLMEWEGGDRAVLPPSGSKCNEKLLWNYHLRHLKHSFWFFSLLWKVQSLVKNNSEEQKTQWNSVSNTLSCFHFSSAVGLRYSPGTYLRCLETKCYWLKLSNSTSQCVSWGEN